MPLVPLAQLKDQPIEWLWPDRLAAGCLHLIDGDPGDGKSLVLADLAARLTTATAWPDGTPSPGAASVLLLNGEDAPGTTRHRLLAAGADPERVHVWDHAPGEEWPRIPDGLEPLARAQAWTGARLVILDPFTAFLHPSVNLASDLDARRALAPLAELARHGRCAIVLARHLRKSGASRALHRGLGSIGLIAVCRIAWMLGPDPRVPGQGVFTQPKSNLGPCPPSLGYTLPERGAEPRMRWLGDSLWVAGDLGRPGADRSQRAIRARQLLERLLQDGPRNVREIYAAGRDLGLSDKFLRGTAKKMGLRFDRVGLNTHGNQTTYWRRADQKRPVYPNDPPELQAWFDHMEEQVREMQNLPHPPS